MPKKLSFAPAGEPAGHPAARYPRQRQALTAEAVAPAQASLKLGLRGLGNPASTAETLAGSCEAVSESFVEEIVGRVAERLVSQLRGQLTGAVRLVGREAMAEVLGVSLQSLDRLVASGAIPSLKLGGLRRFDPQAVLEHVKKAEAGHNE